MMSVASDTGDRDKPGLQPMSAPSNQAGAPIGPADRRQAPKLGTFLGVFTPTVLTILGVILYLRAGWLVGHMGLVLALVIVVAANAITLITSLSFSAVATNGPVGVGGAYYLVSRSLGIEIGGAIGVPMFLSQAFSVTLYAFGLAESLRIIWPGVPVQYVAFATVILVGALAFKGAGTALKAQLPIMALVGISLVALVIGVVSRAPATGIPLEAPSGQVTFWHGFAVFFPAVTGVMAGLGLSGDLRDPQRSIPLGSLAATAAGFVVYLSVPVLLAVGASADVLREDSLVWTRIAPLGAWLILPGLLGAIFSSAVGSILGAPRTLQALAGDRIVPSVFGRLSGRDRQPVLGLVVSLAIALGAVFLGDLDTVAPVVTMFFLTVYGTVNLVAAAETLGGDPSWRPRIRVPWYINLAGGLGCVVAMFLIHPLAASIAIVVEVGIWLLLKRRRDVGAWGDARRGLYEAMIRWALVRLAQRPMAARNWRPHVLVFTDDPRRRLDLVRFGCWFSQGRGVVTAAELIVGDPLSPEIDPKARQREIQQLLDKENVVAFAEVDVVHELVPGLCGVVQANGMAGLQSNTVLLGWPKEPGRLTAYLHAMRRFERLEKSLVLARAEPRYLFPRESVVRTIDVWWGGRERNGDLMLLLAHLLHNNREWDGARVRVLSIASNEMTRDTTSRALDQMLATSRIHAEPHVFIRPKDKSIQQIIHEQSRDAEVVFLGLALPPEGDEEKYGQRLAQLSEGLATVFFVRNASSFGGELV